MKNIKKTLMTFACLLAVSASATLVGCDFKSILGGLISSGSSSETQQSSQEKEDSSKNEKPGDDDSSESSSSSENENAGGGGQDSSNDDSSSVTPNPPAPGDSYRLEYTDNGEGYTVTGKGTFTGGELKIPQTYNGKAVTMIGESAFADCTTLYSLILPQGLTSIGYNAFSGCFNLTSVKVGENLVEQCYVDSGAFSGCYKLAEVYEPMGALHPGDEMTFGGIAKYAINTYSMYMGSSGLSTDENGFVIYTPQPDPMMPEAPVSGETVLVNYVGKEKKVTIPNVYRVGGYAFYGDNCVEEVTVPEGVKMLSDSAFSGNVLKKVIVPASVTSLAGAFRGYVSDVEIAEANTRYKTIDGNVYSKNGEELYQYLPGKTEKEFTVPSNVKKIAVAGFWGSKNLVSVTINENVKEIGSLAFKTCKSLEKVTIKGENTKLGSAVCESVRSLESVEITGSVQIGRSAFHGCIGLVNVNLGEGVTFETSTMGHSNAFDGCTALKQVRIPGSVKTLPSGTFAGCSLDLLVLEEGVERVAKEAFDYTKKIKTIVLPSTMKSVNFSYNNKIETIYYKGTVEQRAQIVYGGVADGIKLAKNWYFYSETTPTDTENQYWHYDSEGNIVLY